MEYVVYRRFKAEGIDGAFNLRYGTTVTERDGFLFAADGRKICAATSENGWISIHAPREGRDEPHDGAAAVYLEIICGTIGKENKKLGLEPTYYGWIDYLHYVTDDDRNDDCNRHILPFERRARIGYTLESILKFVNDLGASFDAVAVCPDLGGYRVFRDGYSPKGTERLNYGDEFQYDPDMTARREAVYRHVYELEKAEGSRYPNFSLWVDQDDPGMLHLLRHFSGTFKTAHNTHWTIRTDTGSTVEDWMATATVTPLGRYGC
mgnify:CR=1 FL=1